VAGYFSIAILQVGLFLILPGSFSASELATSLSIVMPIFAAYTAITLSYLGTNPEETPANPKIMNPTTVAVSFVIPSLAFTLVFLLVIQKAFSGIDFETYRTLLGLVEVIFGGSLGQVVLPHFDKSTPKTGSNDGSPKLLAPSQNATARRNSDTDILSYGIDLWQSRVKIRISRVCRWTMLA
jgi:hypothetical protein